MKKINYFLNLGLGIFVLITSCQPKIDIEKEKAAVKAVLQDETAAYIAMDIDKISTFYVQDEFNTRLQQLCSQELPIYSGWNNVKSYLESGMKVSNPEYKNIKNLKDGFIIKIKDNCAWVVNKDIWTWENNNIQIRGEGLQTTFMEKIDGSWKISMMSYFYRGPSDSTPKDTTTVK